MPHANLHISDIPSPAPARTLVVIWMVYVLAVVAGLSYQEAMIGWLCQTLR